MINGPRITEAAVAAAVRHHLPDHTVVSVEDRGVWVRRNFRITLDDGKVVYLKIDQDFPCSVKEAYISSLLLDHGLPAPQVLALDTTGDLLPAPFIIQAHLGGTRLGELLRDANRSDRLGIYQAMGNFYRRLHGIHHESGGWIGGPGIVYTGSPNENQFDEVIAKIGAQAVAQGHLSADAHRWVQALWAANRAYLDDYQPSLVSGGALHWSIYLEKNEAWWVTKIMDLADLCYWDPAWDLVSIKYPSFLAAPSPELWAAFLDAYGAEPDEKRLVLYLLMRRIDAAMGNYMAPPGPDNEQWQAKAWATFESLLEKAEALS